MAEPPTMAVDKPLLTTVCYVKRDPNRDTTVKPYILYYATPKNFPQSNFAIEPVDDVQMHSLRGIGITYQDHGLDVASVGDRKVLVK